MSLLNMFSPKELILNQIISKFEKEGLNVKKAFCKFDIEKDIFNIEIETDKETENFSLEENEISTLKQIFIKKLLKQREREKPNEIVKSIIIDIDLIEKTIDVYIEGKDLKISAMTF